MRRMAFLLAVLFSAMFFAGCSSVSGSGERREVYWSVTGYVQASGSPDGNRDYWGDRLDLSGGISITLFNHLPAVPAVPNTTRVVVKNTNNVSSSSSSTQSQNQEQNQNGGGNGNGHNHNHHHGHGNGHDCDPDD